MMHTSKHTCLSSSAIQQRRKNVLCGWNAEAEARRIESKDWIRNKYGSVLCNNGEKHLNAIMKQQRKLQGQLDWDHSWGKIGSEKKRKKMGVLKRVVAWRAHQAKLASKLKGRREVVVIYLRGGRGRRAGG